jgi:hypothetical protein
MFSFLIPYLQTILVDILRKKQQSWKIVQEQPLNLNHSKITHSKFKLLIIDPLKMICNIGHFLRYSLEQNA